MGVAKGIVIGGLVAVSIGTAYHMQHEREHAERAPIEDVVHLGSGQSYDVQTGWALNGLPACRISPHTAIGRADWLLHGGAKGVGFEGNYATIAQVEGPRVDNPLRAQQLCNEGARLTPGATGTYFIED